MKTTLFLLVAVSFFLAGCGGDDEGSTTSLQNVIALDAGGTSLGWVLDAGSSSITVTNSDEYIYSLLWDGNLSTSSVYFSASNCSGTTFAQANNGDTSYAKQVVVDGSGTVYIPTTANSNGTAATSTATILSSLSTSGTCTNIGARSTVLPLTATTRSEIGIPDTITPPITLSTE